jgi:prepilin-type N-terminal cleavage/methylation domain-containing protein
MKRFRITPQQSNSKTRQGVTLIEVLMSLMIMSIGVASVAALFPISVLRTVQANQLTNAAIVKYNVEAMVQSDPSWIVDPDRDGNLLEHFRNAQDRNYLVDPIGFYTHFANGDYTAAGTVGNFGLGTPGILRRWGGGISTLPDSLYTQGYRVDALPPVPVPAAAYASALRLAAISKAGQGDGWVTDIDAVPQGLISQPAPFNAIVGVRLATGGDTDLSQVATSSSTLPVTTPPPGFVQVPPLPRPASLYYLIPDPELFRIVVFSIDGKRSQSYPLTYIDTATNSCYWSEDTDADGDGDQDFNMSGSTDSSADIRGLPAEFAGGVSRVLIQSRRLTDFSWTLTVRRRSDGFVRGTDIVVRSKNGADLKDERLFAATFVKDTNIIGIRYPYRVNPLDETVPSLRRGKFVFDAQNALWYRIQDYKERPLGNIGWIYPEYDAVVYTETEISEPAGEDQFTLYSNPVGPRTLLLNGALDLQQYDNATPQVLQQPFRLVGGVPTALTEDEARPGDGDGALDFGAAMFPSGVVDVYPMGSMPLPSSL